MFTTTRESRLDQSDRPASPSCSDSMRVATSWNACRLSGSIGPSVARASSAVIVLWTVLIHGHRDRPRPFDVLAVDHVLLLLPGGEDEPPGEEPERDDGEEEQEGEDGSEADPADRLPWTHAQTILSRDQLEPAFNVNAKVRRRRPVLVGPWRRARPARSSRSCRTSVFHGPDLEEVHEHVDEERADPRIEERTRAGAPPAISMPNVSPADSDEEREELTVGLVAGIAAAGGEHAGFLVAGVAEEPQLGGQHDHPRVPHAAVVPLEVEDGARAERGGVEARAVVAERPLDRRRRAGSARAGCGWETAPRAS